MKQMPYYYITRTNGVWNYVSPLGRSVGDLNKCIELLTN